MTFKKAVRTQVKLKIAITGPSGAGKTMSGLLIAQGMGKKIAVIDTENSSASLYADRFNFDTLCIYAPYTVQKYIDAMKAAEQAGYEVLVIDSLSHCWIGEGGLLAEKEALDARGGNSFANWASISKKHELLKSAILNANINMICTIRSKQDYAQEKDERGKTVIKKVGLAPQQRDGLEFEFGVVFDLGMDHQASVSKDRTSIFDGTIFKPDQDTGKQLMTWLSSGEPITPAAQSTPKTAPETVAPPKQTPAATVDVPCDLCGTMVVLHHTKAGYYCPKKTAKGDGHLQFSLEKLPEFLARAKTLQQTTSDDVA
jgi:hypothetical protein